MVPHIGSEASAGLAGSGGDWGVCVDAPVVVGRCAVGPPPLRRFFRAEGVAKKCLRSAHGWESGVESLMEPQIGIRGRNFPQVLAKKVPLSFNGAPDRNPGKGRGDVRPVAILLAFQWSPR